MCHRAQVAASMDNRAITVLGPSVGRDARRGDEPCDSREGAFDLERSVLSE